MFMIWFQEGLNQILLQIIYQERKEQLMPKTEGKSWEATIAGEVAIQ